MNDHDSEFDRELRDQVHPPDWRNPTPKGPYQLVVIGAGTAGLVAAAGAAGLGARVALIENAFMGGDCLNFGCVPSKALIRSARVAATVRDADRFGIHAADWQTDFAGVMRRMRKLRAQISPHDSATRFSKLGVDVFFGQGSFVDDESIHVHTDGGVNRDATLTFRRAVIATGARAAVPSIPGLNTIDYLTNETLFSLTELPNRLGIIGAGPIGCEMSQTFSRLGCQVSLFDRNDRVLHREDAAAAETLTEQLKRDGIQLCLGSRDLRVQSRGDETHVVSGCPGGQETVSVDRLLIASGRTPNIERLNLSSAGITSTKHGINTNDFLQTTNPNVYAAGDVCSKLKFTHAADFQARIVIQNALFALGPFGRKKASQLLIPRVTYTSPEIAQVGITAKEAEASGIGIQTFHQSLSEVDRAILDGECEGFVTIHVARKSDQILGASVVAQNAGEMISEITLAMNTKVGLSKLANNIHPYPTQSDAIRKLGDQCNRTKLTPLNKRLLSYLMRWNVGR
ncbi:mercuric reductase [Rhodopirellula sp. MGV]|uniref:mercuric reductase n=1 Tax=Rhodopirellula sp. MGV TaxID=2023130 RepID=UPI000B960976|nr:mercuric reductase [Rhodopirellula sp. MGV]OYP37484.1 mercuric reductase [Rhodopirellula sp. MGV]PNY37886.1 FAD-binding protein [Rhodopirellula baltica]